MKRVETKKNRLLFICLSIVLILLVVAACTGKGSVEESGSTAPDAAGVETKTEQDTSDEALVKDVTAKENPGNPGDNDVNESENKGVQEEKADSSEVKKGPTEKPGSPESQVQPGLAKESGNNVILWVTKDFGNKSILQKTVALQKDWSVFEVLETSARITTAHGGGFIDSINGIKSDSGGLGGKKQDWFYYVNGVFADVGALDYYPQPGEVIWWDYHAWKNMSMFPAVIGCYPEPFVHGYRGKVGPVTIMCAEDSRNLAGDLQTALKNKGVASVSVKDPDANLLKNRQGPTIVLGQWSVLSQIEWLINLNKAHTKIGTCVHFTGDGVELLDYKGRVARTINESCGVIAATGEGMGDESPLWLIVGTDPEGLQQAVDILVKSPGKISGLYNAAILAGEVIRLPVQ